MPWKALISDKINRLLNDSALITARYVICWFRHVFIWLSSQLASSTSLCWLKFRDGKSTDLIGVSTENTNDNNIDFTTTYFRGSLRNHFFLSYHGKSTILRFTLSPFSLEHKKPLFTRITFTEKSYNREPVTDSPHEAQLNEKAIKNLYL